MNFVRTLGTPAYAVYAIHEFVFHLSIGGHSIPDMNAISVPVPQIDNHELGVPNVNSKI